MDLQSFFINFSLVYNVCLYIFFYRTSTCKVFNSSIFEFFRKVRLLWTTVSHWLMICINSKTTITQVFIYRFLEQAQLIGKSFGKIKLMLRKVSRSLTVLIFISIRFRFFYNFNCEYQILQKGAFNSCFCCSVISMHISHASNLNNFDRETKNLFVLFFKWHEHFYSVLAFSTK